VVPKKPKHTRFPDVFESSEREKLLGDSGGGGGRGGGGGWEEGEERREEEEDDEVDEILKEMGIS